MSCLLAGRPVELAEIGWITEIRRQLHHDDMDAASLAILTARVVSLYATLQASSSGYNNLLEQCYILDQELDVWEKQLPPLWLFTSQPSTTKNSFHNTTHQYQDFWLARMLTNYRWTRIIICHLILLHTTQISQPNSGNITPHLKAIQRLSTDICHSVPYFLEPSVVQQMHTTPFPIFAGCFVVMFPLAVVGCAVGVEEDTQRYAIGVLKMLDDKMGIAGAKTMVEYVEQLRQQWQNYTPALQEDRFVTAEHTKHTELAQGYCKGNSD